MMMRVCVLPQEVKTVHTRSRKGDTAWFADRHMQVKRKESLLYIKLVAVGIADVDL